MDLWFRYCQVDSTLFCLYSFLPSPSPHSQPYPSFYPTPLSFPLAFSYNKISGKLLWRVKFYPGMVIEVDQYVKVVAHEGGGGKEGEGRDRGREVEGDNTSAGLGQ